MRKQHCASPWKRVSVELIWPELEEVELKVGTQKADAQYVIHFDVGVI